MNRILTCGYRDCNLEARSEPFISGMTTSVMTRWISSLRASAFCRASAGSPAEALPQAEARSEEIHMVITDVVMPEMNGSDLASRLQSLYPHVKILFMSGYTADVIAHRGIMEEEVHFIAKPFSTRGLAVKVREALQ